MELSRWGPDWARSFVAEGRGYQRLELGQD